MWTTENQLDPCVFDLEHPGGIDTWSRVAIVLTRWSPSQSRIPVVAGTAAASKIKFFFWVGSLSTTLLSMAWFIFQKVILKI